MVCWCWKVFTFLVHCNQIMQCIFRIILMFAKLIAWNEFYSQCHHSQFTVCWNDLGNHKIPHKTDVKLNSKVCFGILCRKTWFWARAVKNEVFGFFRADWLKKNNSKHDIKYKNQLFYFYGDHHTSYKKHATFFFFVSFFPNK